MESESISVIVRSRLPSVHRPIVSGAIFHTSCYRGGAGQQVLRPNDAVSDLSCGPVELAKNGLRPAADGDARAGAAVTERIF